MSTENRFLKLLAFTWVAAVLPNFGSAQDVVRDIPFHQRTANSPTTVPDNEDLADLPQFMVDPFWPKPLPNNWMIGQVSGVHVDSDDHIWIVQRPRSLSERDIAATLDPPLSKCCFPAPPVLEFDLSGNLLRAWGGSGDGYDWPRSEHGIHLADGFVWLAGNGQGDSQILKFTMDGEFVMQVGKPDQSAGSNDTENLGRPADMFVDVEAGEIYVADGYGNRRVVVFDTETGAYRRHWGAYGNTPHDDPLPPYDPAATPSQQFGNPVHCVQVSRDGLVYVCDRVNDRVQIFQKDGTFVAEAFFEPDTLMNGSVYDLVLSLDTSQSLMFMVDGMNSELRIIDRASNATRGRVGRAGRWAGQFYGVHDITLDSQGNLYTTEVGTGQRVQKFRRLSQ